MLMINKLFEVLLLQIKVLHGNTMATDMQMINHGWIARLDEGEFTYTEYS